MFLNTNNPSGESISTTQGTTVTKQYTVTLPSDINDVGLNISNLHLVAFLTEAGNLNSPIVTGAEGDIDLDLPAGTTAADMSATATHTAPATLCTAAFTPKITVENNGATSISSYTVSYKLNGGTEVSEDITVALAGGATFEHSFPQINLPAGTNIIEYNSNSDNSTGTVDFSTGNNKETAYLFNVPNSSVGTTFSEDFESTTVGADEPNGATNHNPDYNSTYVMGSTTTDLGYNSANSFRWDFYSIKTNVADASLVLHKLDFTSTTNNALSFWRAYAGYVEQGTTYYGDKLFIEVSTDCGANWTEVYQKEGEDLDTDPADASRYYPINWEQDVVNLSAYDGESEVMIRFRGKSGYSNSLYVDNINVNSTLLSIEDNTNNTNLSVYPNPANGSANVAINTTEASNVTISIVNTLGQTVFTKDLGTVSGESITTINTSNLEAGMYMVNTTINGTVSTERLSVVK